MDYKKNRKNKRNLGGYKTAEQEAKEDEAEAAFIRSIFYFFGGAGALGVGIILIFIVVFFWHKLTGKDHTIGLMA